MSDFIPELQFNGPLIDGPISILKDGSVLKTRPRINFVQGSNITITSADDAVNYRTDITVSTANISIVINNRAALRAYTGAVNNQFINELGYTVDGDGGGGLWHFSYPNTTAVDNDGTIIVPGGTYGSTATQGCWFRYGFGPTTSNNNPFINVRWFGAGTVNQYTSCVTPVLAAFNAIKTYSAAVGTSTGKLYFPTGSYSFNSKLSLNATGYSIDVIGNGNNTKLTFGFGANDIAVDDCMIQFSNFGEGSIIGGFAVTNPPLYTPCNFPYSILRFTSCNSCIVKDIVMSNMMTDGNFGSSSGITYIPNNPMYQGPTGAIWYESGSQTNFENIVIGSFGTAFCVGGDSGGTQPSARITNCWFKQSSTAITGVFTNGISGVKPTLVLASADTFQIDNIFVENGGPFKAFQGSTITSSGTYFTVTTPVAHNFLAGDYIVINGATNNTAYNKKWRITSIPSTTTIRVNETIASNETGVYCTSLYVCCLFGGGVAVSGSSSTSVAESTFRNIYTNQGGRQLQGSSSLYFCARKGNSSLQSYCGGILLSDMFCDYGENSIFIHGSPIAGYTATAISISNCRANGGPRTDFGGIRVEIGQQINIDGCYWQAALTAYPSGVTGLPSSGNWSLTPITAVAISDGGTSNGTAYGVNDVAITGGVLQSASQTSGLGALYSAALSVDGSKIVNIKTSGALIDLTSSNSTPLVLTNGATRNNSSTTPPIKAEIIACDFYTGRTVSVYATSTQAIANTTGTYVNFQAAELNDDIMWNSGNPTRITINKNIYRVKFNINLQFAAAPGAGAYVQLVKNSSDVWTMGWPNGSPYCSASFGTLTTALNDIWEVLVYQSSGVSINLSPAGGSRPSGNQFIMEIVK